MAVRFNQSPSDPGLKIFTIGSHLENLIRSFKEHDSSIDLQTVNQLGREQKNFNGANPSSEIFRPDGF